MKLAICSTNRRKYSETFIQAHYELLKGGDMLLCDGYQPTVVSEDGGKSFQPIIQKSLLPWRARKSASQALEDLLSKRNVEVVLAEYGPAGVEMLPICTKLNIPLVVHFHGYDAYRSDVLSSYGQEYSKLFHDAFKVVAVSSDMVKQLQKLGCPEDRIQYVAYGIDTKRFYPQEQAETNFHLVFCGRFVPKKAPLKILRAFAIILAQRPKAKLTMIGDGELLNASKALAKTLKIDQSVRFTGPQPPDEVAAHLRSADVLLQHSVITEAGDSEGTPLSILEAMACGAVVVATRHGGIPDVIEHEQTGMLVNEGDLEGMAQLALQLLDDQSIRGRIAKAARAWTLAHHRKDQMLDSLKVLLNQSAR